MCSLKKKQYVVVVKMVLPLFPSLLQLPKHARGGASPVEHH